MAPRPKNPENRGLPARWRFRDGAYRYQVPPGLEHLWDGRREFTLGKTMAEAGAAWGQRVQPSQGVRTVGDLLDAFCLRYVPTLSAKTQASYLAACINLRKVFGQVLLAHVEPHHVYQYVEARQPRLTAAHREIEVLSMAYTKAIEWGYISYHPIKGKVRLMAPKKRTRYVEDAELLAFKRAAGAEMFAYVWIRELTGLRRADILTLQPARHFTDAGIAVQPRKTAKTTGKRLLIEWTPELCQAVALAMAARPKDIAPWLFCNRMGACHFDERTGNANGWDSKWQRTMDRALKAGLAERFTDRDIRKKVASDAPTLERAAALLGHADTRTTARHYRIGFEKVTPTR